MESNHIMSHIENIDIEPKAADMIVYDSMYRMSSRPIFVVVDLCSCGSILLANVNSSSRSLYVIGRPSDCLSVCLSSVHPTQAIEIFGNISTPCGTLAIHDLCIKILRRSSQGNPSVEGVNTRGVTEYSEFGPIQRYISETVQDRS